jgi:hypothetical protein
MGTNELLAALVAAAVPAIASVAVLASLAIVAIRASSRVQIPGGIPFVIAFTALGVTTGMSAGNSREPVVGALLPAMLTLVSGLLTYLFSKESLANWRQLIPYSIIVLAVGSLVGLSLGSTLRKRLEEDDRAYARALLRYQSVDLEYEKAKHLAELEVWKRQELARVGIIETAQAKSN